MTSKEAAYRIIEPLRELNAVDLEKEGGVIIVNRERLERYLKSVKEEIVRALEDDGK